MDPRQPIEHRVRYQSSNSYATLNELQATTHTVWLVFHGIGYLSRYFLKYFTGLPSHEHFIIAPQGPSKYYLKDDYKHVGASWLTRENTLEDLEYVLSYLDAVWDDISIGESCTINILGYSQGASIALRWICHSKLPCNKLILYAGGIPNEITQNDVAFLGDSTEVFIVYGKRDEFLTVERMANEEQKIKMLFGDRAQRISFEGGHEMRPEVLHRFT